MNPSKRTRQLLLLLLLVVSSALFFRENSGPVNPAGNQQTGDLKPDAFTTRSSIMNYRSSSEASFILKSSESVYFKESGKLNISTPKLELLDDNGNRYRVESDQGVYLENENTISFSGNVKLRQTHLAQEQKASLLASTEVSSESLSIDIDKRFIYTEQAVKITHDNHTLNAVGMHVFLENNTLELLNQVRGRYELN